MKRKPFVVDYQIQGTLHLSSPNHIAVALRAEGLIHRAMEDLKDVSVYCEETIDVPIDATERYLKGVA
jgi:hypothetical protein